MNTQQSSIHRIDLNCDMGESFGTYTIGNDDALLPFASSVNIACGYHAGDPSVMRRTVEKALQHNAAIGAHPGLPDKEGFGRREMKVSAEEVYDMTLYQIAALDGIVRASGGAMTHVKPHGALYNMLAVSEELSEACCNAVHALNPRLIIVGLAGSATIRIARAMGLRAASEGFADRRYLSNGLLMPRSLPGACIRAAEDAAEQAMAIVLHKRIPVGRVKEQIGEESNHTEYMYLEVETLCLHGDNPNAVHIAKAISQRLQSSGVHIASLPTDHL